MLAGRQSKGQGKTRKNGLWRPTAPPLPAVWARIGVGPLTGKQGVDARAADPRNAESDTGARVVVTVDDATKAPILRVKRLGDKAPCPEAGVQVRQCRPHV